MTGLGATIYIGFFALAALWLFVSGRGPATGVSDRADQAQLPVDSNSESFAAEADGYNRWLASHSSLK